MQEMPRKAFKPTTLPPAALLVLGCLVAWLPAPAPAAARAATVTTDTSGIPATPAASGVPATAAPPDQAPVPGSALGPGTAFSPSTPQNPRTPAGEPVQGSGLVPDGKGHGMHRPNVPGIRIPNPTISSNGIFYHGGPVLLGTTHVYFIWYGSWGSDTATTILPDWAKNLGGSPLYAINTTYFDGSNRSISNSVTFGGAAFDAYSLGTSLGDGDIYTIVAAAIAGGSLPLDGNGVYFVLTSPDVAETSGFCTVYCGWHASAPFGAVVSQYAFVGNPTACPDACIGSPGNDPNGNEGADGMASIMTHELDEAVTDPHGDAWYDNAGNEVADLCNFTFGSVYSTANGSIANVRLGARDFLLQEEWVNASGGFCAIGLPQNTRYYTVTPCRAVDTRGPAGPTGGPALQSNQTRSFPLAGLCGIPSTAKALAANITVTGPATAGYLTLYAADQQPGGTSTINFPAGTTRANNAILRLSGEGSGSIDVLAALSGTAHVIVDVTGYFQ